MLYSGTDPESYITEYTLVYEEINLLCLQQITSRAQEGPRQAAGGGSSLWKRHT